MRAQAPSYRSDTGREDRDIAARCRKGDVEAFEELYKRYSARLYSVAYRMTGSAADAEDLESLIALGKLEHEAQAERAAPRRRASKPRGLA